MTAGSGEIPIKNFEDVIHHDYRVVTHGPFYRGLLQSAGAGSAKHQVYKMHLENEKLWKNSKSPSGTYMYDFLRRISGVWTGRSGCEEWCRTNLETPTPSKTLLYTSSNYVRSSGNQKYDEIIEPLFALKMNDDVKLSGGHALQKDSEFLPIFNHYLGKQFENGMIYFSLSYGGRMGSGRRGYGLERKQFGMTEPEALPFNSVQFAFMFLGGAILTSMVISICEFIFKQIAMESRVQSRQTNTPLDEKPKMEAWQKESKSTGMSGF